MTASDVFNLAQHCLELNARERPDSEALIFHPGAHDERIVYSFREFENRVRCAATVLRRTVPSPGSRVLIRLESGPEFALIFFAAITAGLVPVPSSPDLTSIEADFLVRDAEVALTIFSDSPGPPSEPGNKMHLRDFTSWVEDAVPGVYANTRPEEPAFLIYTSGTSGRPRGVLHAQRSVLGRLPMRDGWTDLRADDRLLHAGRLNWTYTLGVGLMDPWMQGATCVLYGGQSDPAVWPRLMETERATIFAAVPGVYRRLLKYGRLEDYDLGALRHALTAGEKLVPELRESWRERTGTEIYEALGMSEISTYISMGPGIAHRARSSGKPQPGRRVAILKDEPGSDTVRFSPPGEPGLLAVHREDPGLMLRYWKRPEQDAVTMRGDWFVGGDLAAMDQDGYVYFHGRNDEIMNASGYRVSPLEVDHVLLAHSDVAEAAVTELPVENGLSIIAAFIVLRETPTDDASALKQEILDFAAKQLARYKLPREVRFVESLPRNANGKLQRKKLRDAYVR